MLATSFVKSGSSSLAQNPYGAVKTGRVTRRWFEILVAACHAIRTGWRSWLDLKRLLHGPQVPSSQIASTIFSRHFADMKPKPYED